MPTSDGLIDSFNQEESSSSSCDKEAFHELDNSSSRGTSHSESSESTSSSNRRERAVLNRSKMLVYLSLLIAAISVTISTYFFVRKGETKLFESEAGRFANHILLEVEEKIQTTFRSIHEVSVQVTAGALESNAVWPNFTLSHFHHRTEEALEVSGAKHFAFAPLVESQQLKTQWEAYARENQGWLQDSLLASGSNHTSHRVFPQEIETLQEQGSVFVPLWQMEPAPLDSSVLLQDLLSLSWFRRLVANASFIEPKMSSVEDTSFLDGILDGNADMKGRTPHSFVIDPVLETFPEEGGTLRAAGFILADVPWQVYFTGLLPDGMSSFIIVVQDTCGSSFTYEAKGEDAIFVGVGDLHNHDFDGLERGNRITSDLHSMTGGNDAFQCYYSIRIYPSEELRSSYETTRPFIFAGTVLMVFLATMLVFFIYDCSVQRRQDRLSATAKQTTAIVASLFPKNVQTRIMEEAQAQAKESVRKSRSFFTASHVLKNIAAGESEGDVAFQGSSAIADLYPSATIMFADLVGFTAWSSMRQPHEVFELLETIFSAFDVLAKSRRVFKVETVGDCYVAVAGLPEPRRDHAVVMARFAQDCITELHQILPELEQKLGPDTAEMGVRVGLHSGPVTAGVLRGDRARFQLFGDTVNTAARVESSGTMNKIHASAETAHLLRQSGKDHWLTPRGDKVIAKGKGELVTYWLDVRKGINTSISGSRSSDGNSSHCQFEEVSGNELVLSEKTTRLVTWCTDVLTRQLKMIGAKRQAGAITDQDETILDALELRTTQDSNLVRDEIKDVIPLPQFDRSIAEKWADPDSVVLPDAVISQLKDFVAEIASRYHDNPFHCFEHVSHVSMSVVKLLSRIVAPDLGEMAKTANEETIHDHTYGIASDPMTRFAVVFSAIVHDVDHQGVPNAQLVKEKKEVATKYEGKSVAEQNSVQIAWDLLMEDRFHDLRRAIYATEAEFYHFRRLVVNSVMATDIMDKELSAARKARWSKAFAASENVGDTAETITNRKATIVIEHLIQASDVSHTMQHWHVYRKWNARLFEEMCHAYEEGRAEVHPAENWYKGELGFFDFYIIPLAKKLKDCGVFGVSSDEYLNYALKNRAEWETKGQEIVAEMVERLKGKGGD